MAKSLSSILSQIERLQNEAAAIQLDVVSRIRKEIQKYGLTAEQLFGGNGATSRGRAKTAAGKPDKAAKVAKAPKYADGTGNTWGGMGKRPDWLRQALESGKSLQDFLIGATATAPEPIKPTKAATAKRKAPARSKVAAKKRTASKAGAASETKPTEKKPAARKSRKAAVAPAES